MDKDHVSRRRMIGAVVATGAGLSISKAAVGGKVDNVVRQQTGKIRHLNVQNQGLSLQIAEQSFYTKEGVISPR